MKKLLLTYLMLLLAFIGFSQNFFGSHTGENHELPTVVLHSLSQEGYPYCEIAAVAEVIDDGGTTVTERGIVTAISNINPTIGNRKIRSGSGVGSYNIQYNGLNGQTTYYVRAYAINELGISYSSRLSITSGLAPEVSISLTNFTETTADFFYDLTDNGNLIDMRLLRFSTTDPYVYTWTSIKSAGAGQEDVNFHVTGLVPNTTYYVKGVTNSECGNQGLFSDVISFTTLSESVAPTVTTTAISNIAPTTATSGGNINDDGGSPVTERGIVWKIASSGIPHLGNYDGITSDGSGPGSYSSALSGLTPGTTYNVRAYATNSQGTAYGGQISFTTAEQQIACNADASYKEGSQSFPGIYAVTLGSGTGIVTFNFNAFGIPDKFIVIYDGNEVINTGYRGSSIYQGSLNTALGTPETITEPGSGTETFNKTSSSSVATVYVYAPLSGTGWNFQMSCPGVPLARVIYEPVQVDLKSESLNNLKDNENLIFREGMYWKAVGIQTGQDTIIINK